MDNMFSLEELKAKFSSKELLFTRAELATAFTGKLFGRVFAAQITRDIQALYGKRLDRKPIPFDVAIELYLIRIFRFHRTRLEEHRSRIHQNELLEFIKAFEKSEDPNEVRNLMWAYAREYGGGEQHFNNEVVKKILEARKKRCEPQTVTVEHSFI